MSGRAATVRAYRTLDLKAGADFDAVKAAFRRQVKAVHPDSNETTPETLARLAALLNAYEHLKEQAPRCVELTLTPEEARKGGLRTVAVGERNAMVRLPKDARSAMVLTPIGDPNWRIRLVVRDEMVEEPPETAAKSPHPSTRTDADRAREEAAAFGGLLDGFMERFVRASPAARLAKWVRGGRAA